MKIPLLKLDFSEEDINFVLEGTEKVLRSGFLTMNSNVIEFEEAFADFCGVNYALSTNSGTSSLEMALRVIDVQGGTVVMPSNTYMATPLAAIKAGAKVIFTDCEENNLQIDPIDLEKKIREDTRAEVVVHIGGIISPRINSIKQLCESRNIPLIEDCAHAHGSESMNRRAGSIGVAGSFSFYPTKVLTTAEGGMLTTNDSAMYKKAKILREHGKQDHSYNIHTEIGDNWRFSEIHAVLGLQQMRKADWILKTRRRLAKIYDDKLQDFKLLEILKIPSGVKSAFYKYITFLPETIDRNALKDQLSKNHGINFPGEVYSEPCHNQPVFKKYPHHIVNSNTDRFPVTEKISRTQLCLPLYPGLKDNEQEYVVQSLKEVLLSF